MSLMNASLPHDDPRSIFAAAVATASAVIEAAQPGQLDGPTPCPEHNVRNLIGHLTAVLGRVEALGLGNDPLAQPEVLTGVADDQWPAAFSSAAHAAQAAWADPSLLAKEMTLPWAQLPGAGMLAMYTSEVTVHTWDLAQATGQHPNFDEQAVTLSLTAMQHGLPDDDREGQWAAMQQQMPEEFAGHNPPFANAVAVPDDAPPIDQLVAWTGRNPNQ